MIRLLGGCRWEGSENCSTYLGTSELMGVQSQEGPNAPIADLNARRAKLLHALVEALVT